MAQNIVNFVFVGKNPSRLKKLRHPFRQILPRDYSVATVHAHAFKDEGYDLNAEIAISQPVYEEDDVLRTLSMMELFSLDYSVKMAIIPSRLFEKA